MEILYFLTYGYSLKTWSDSGQLAREIKHFEALKSENEKIKFKIFSYGEDNDFEYIEKAQKLGLPEEKLSDLLTKSDREINEVLNKLVKDKPKGMKAGGMVMNYGDYGRTYK